MSDSARTDRDPTSSGGATNPSASLLRRLAGQMLDAGRPPGTPASNFAQSNFPPSPAGIRIDEGHSGRRRAAGSPSEGRSAADRDALAGEAEVPTGTSSRLTRQEEEVLREATQIAEHFRQERQDLERREQALNEQHSLLDKEWRNARLWVHEFEDEMQQRQTDLKTHEDELAEKTQACETLVCDLEEQERLILSLRDQIAAERDKLRDAVDRELEIERLTLQQTRAALDDERAAVREETERRRREHDELTRNLTGRLEAERAALRNQLAAQLDAERAVFEEERAAWNQQRTLEETELRQSRDITQTASQRAQEELSSLRRREFDDLRQERESLRTQLEVDRQTLERDRKQLEIDRQQLFVELAEVRKSQADEIDRERALARDQIAAANQELDGARARIEQELKQRVDQRERDLQGEQKKLEEEHHRQIDRLAQERNLLENRIRFQQDHLQKARQEVEAVHNELRKQHQADRADIEHREQGLRFRHAQLVHFRAVLEEREQSLSREHVLLGDQRRTLEAEISRQHEALAREQAAFQADRESRQSELSRLEEAAALESDQLASRRQRLDGLRIELEDTHRGTLEMRMAIEEVWAQLSQDRGGEVAKRRLTETQQLLEENFEQIRQTIARERRELVDLQAALDSQRDVRRREERQLAESAAASQAEIGRRSRELSAESATLSAAQTELEAARQIWAQEKLEVEQIIRGLLQQLGQQAEGALSDPRKVE